MIKNLLTVSMLTVSLGLSAQNITVTFDNLSLGAESFWNGSDGTGDFTVSGAETFPNSYDDNWGYWSGGWGYSNLTDSSVAGNPHNVYGTGGYNGSGIYANGKHNSSIYFQDTINGVLPSSVFINNSAYAGIVMRDGNQFGKQFGSPNDANGNPDGTNGEDWFLLTIYGYGVDGNLSDSTTFYLADYRFSNNAQDYIVNQWTEVDLSNFGPVKELKFKLTSSDVGAWGMNTPAFFCLDQLTYLHNLSVEENQNAIVKAYPNPTANTLNFSDKIEGEIMVFDMFGKMIKSFNNVQKSIDLSDLSTGIYQISTPVLSFKIIKQ